MISTLVNKTWFSWYPCWQQIIYDNGSEFKLHFESPCNAYDPQANAILEHVYQVIMAILHTAEIDMANTVVPSDIDTFLTDVAQSICSNYQTVRKASPGAAIFCWDTMFNIPYLADWGKIGGYRQCQTDLNTLCENRSHIYWDYKVGDQVLIWKEGILHKTESWYDSDPWNIMSVHTNGTIRVQCEQSQND